MIRDIATIMRGTLIAQGLGFLALPLLSRLFSPEAFGNYQLFVSILTLLLVFPTLRYEVALLRAHEGREFRALAQLCLYLSILVAAVISLLLVLLDTIGFPRQIQALPFPVWMLGLALLFGGIVQFLTIIATRQKRFATIANSKILQAGAYAGTGLGIGTATHLPTGLIVADLAGRIANAVYLGIWAKRTMRRTWRPVGRASLAAVARRYREYPFISVPGTVINVVGGILTPVMIYASFSPAASGQYGLLDRSINLPLGLVVIAVSQVFTAQFSAELRRDTKAAAAYFRRVLGYMGLLALAPLLILLIAGPWLFEFVFGAEWRVAGELSQLMAPAFGCALLSGPVNMVLTVMGHQKLQTSWEVARLSLVAGLWAAVPRMNISLYTAVGLYSLILVICNVGFIALAYVMLRRAVRGHSGPLSVDAL